MLLKESNRTNIKVIMTMDEKIKDEKALYRAAAKILTLSSGKIHKNECLTGEEILPLDQGTITEQSRYTYLPFRKAFKKQAKTIEDQGKNK